MGEFDHIHIVDFCKYCQKCKYEKVKDYVEPCNSCICTGARVNTRVPLNFEERVKKQEE